MLTVGCSMNDVYPSLSDALLRGREQQQNSFSARPVFERRRFLLERRRRVAVEDDRGNVSLHRFRVPGPNETMKDQACSE